MKAVKLKDDNLEKVTGGTGFESADYKSPEANLPFWWKEPTENNKKPTYNDDPLDPCESNFFSDYEGTPDW